MATETMAARAPVAQRWRIPFREAVVAYVVARVLTLVVVIIADHFTHRGLVHALSIWDGDWFLRAIKYGYPHHLVRVHGAVVASPIAFFPLFPLLLRALADVTRLSPAVVGLVVSAVSGLGAVLAVGHLTRRYASEDAARRAALLFALSPGGFVFSLIYNEGILITLIAVGIGALLSRRWLLAGVLGALATATAPVGVLFVLCCAWAAAVAVHRRREWRSLAAPLLAPVGLLAWFGYLWAHTGTPLAWQLTERGGWHSYASVAYPVRVLGKFLANPFSPTMTGQILVAGTLASLVGLYFVYRERPPTLIVLYATSAVALFAISAPVGLRPRFIMLAFPLVTAAGTRLRGRPFRVAVAVSALLLVLMSVETLFSWAVFP